MQDKKPIILLGENCSEKFLLAKKIMEDTDFVLKNISGKEVDNFLDYYKAEKEYMENGVTSNFVDHDKLKQLIEECKTAIYFSPSATDFQSIVNRFIGFNIETLLYINFIDSVKDIKMSNLKVSQIETNKRTLSYVRSKKKGDYSPLRVILISPFTVKGKSVDDKIVLTIQLYDNSKIALWDVPIHDPFYQKGIKNDDYSMSPEHFEEFKITPISTIYTDGLNRIILSLLGQPIEKSINVGLLLLIKIRNFFERNTKLKLFCRIFYFRTWDLRMIRRLLDVIFMMVLFQIWPEQVYRFSTRKQLPEKGKRKKRNLGEVLLPFRVNLSTAKGVKMMKEANLVMRGNSLDMKIVNKLASPIFLVSFVDLIHLRRLDQLFNSKSSTRSSWSPYRQKGKFIFVYPDAHYISSLLDEDLDCLWIDCREVDNSYQINIKSYNEEHQKIREKGRFVTSLKTLYPHLPGPGSWTPTGSGLVAIGSLYPFAEKMNVYGWDFHLNASPNTMNYLKLLLNMYDYKYDKRSRNHFESMLINMYYGYHLSKLPNVTVHGYLGQLDRHKKMIDRIERVLFD